MDTVENPVLPGLAKEVEPLSLLPAAGREEPAVWISKLAVYKDWPPSADTLLRQVFELHRGLNILRASTTGATNEASRLAGHGAGKTTFCRLIRYVLGEEPAGTRSFREGFRAKFDNGWVLAEVFVAGERWLVGRPLSQSGYHPFARRDVTLDGPFPESPWRQGFKEDYLTAIDRAVFTDMTFRKLADSQKTLDWPRLLPWLSRDQEAHFSGLLEWRHTDSDHDSPVVSHDDRANLVRLMLGLVDEEEQRLLGDFARKAALHEEQTRDRPKMEFAVERERLTLQETLGIKVESPDAPLLQTTVDQKVAQLRNEADQALASVKQDDEMDRLITEVSQKQAEWGIINAFVEELDEEIEQAEAKAANSQPPKPKPRDPLRDTLNGMGPFPGYCSHPMTKAWKEQCPIAHERPKEDEITDETRKIAAEVKPEVARIGALKVELERRRKLGVPKKQAYDAAVRALSVARKRHQDELEKLKAPGREAARIEALLGSYRKAGSDLAEWDKELVELKEAKEKLDEKLAELAKHHRALVEQFSRIFNHIAQLMLGPAVTGTVRIKGKALLPELEYHGPRDSAALKVVRWLIFDLAALALGITNPAAHHPRFLMHDSPREADLAAAIYVSLFTAAQELEGTNGAPAFQYIVSTTEPPSEALNKKPWLIDPVLDASIEEGRLLGVDI
jgi:chaperonin cofactor prefoldin